ncbi:Replication termination factor 2 [Coemansia aciculifera]|uniref:Replication termination factor 2 n=2 Tax=Coemansia TaxID=4863 RepID=A0A9W8GRZ4_9FUNG|nr:Replication termination factor 2 [Coemansia pectinata]KAJ2868182.1 Replication termination factor 2 [Coemansia aciculifera]KAJ2877086.1 Replication termination factor 2 [Coemansia aciculifera]
MGNDGGSIPRRNEMVREKKKDEKADRKNQAIAQNFFCALSKLPLQEPIVGDELGRLYNREAVLEYLLDRSAFGDGHSICDNIQSLKDVKTLKLTANPTTSKKPTSLDGQPAARFVCPITMKEMNGNSAFEFIWSCGCVFSEKARRELPDASTCIVCDAPFVDSDVVPINSVDLESLDTLKGRMAVRKREREDRKKVASKAKSKSKNGKRKHEDDGGGTESGAANKTGLKAAKTQKSNGMS